jgi:hypothetical protein
MLMKKWSNFWMTKIFHITIILFQKAIQSILMELTNSSAKQSTQKLKAVAEIKISGNYSKSIIAVEPWASEKTSTVVKNAADKVVKWNGKSLADAIRELF